MEVRNGSSSFFDGGLFSLIGYSILAGIMTALTFGIAYPWALCMLYGWKINHTVVEGNRMRFIEIEDLIAFEVEINGQYALALNEHPESAAIIEVYNSLDGTK